MIVLTSVFVGLVTLALWSMLGHIIDSRRSKIPGPIPLPIIGNGHEFVGDTQFFLNAIGKKIQEYGNLFRVYILNKRFIVVTDPKHAEAVLSSNDFITKSEIYRYMRPWLGDGLLTSTGSKWKAHRKLVTPAFHFNILQTFVKIFLKNDKIFIENLRKIATGKTVDVFPIVALMALDNVAESAMGVTLNAQNESESEYVRAIAVVSEIISIRMFHLLKTVDVLYWFTEDCRRERQALKILHGHTEKIVRERMKQLSRDGNSLMQVSEFGTKNKCTFLDLLLLAELDGEKLSETVVREEVDTFMFEGHDTTTSAISFALYCISKHEDVQKKLYQEVLDIYGADPEKELSYSDLQNMKYLELVIKETLRMYPSVPLVARRVPEDLVIEDQLYLKDSTVTVDVFHMHRDSKYYDNPLTFRPERFCGDTERNPFSFVAFSAGPRNCIGQKFAMLELKVAISSVVRHFKLLPVDYEPQLGADLILRSKNGINVRFLPRE